MHKYAEREARYASVLEDPNSPTGRALLAEALVYDQRDADPLTVIEEDAWQPQPHAGIREVRLMAWLLCLVVLIVVVASSR